MPSDKSPKTLIICESIAESTRLMVLLSALTKDITCSADYKQGLALLQAADSDHQPYDIIFLSMPPDNHKDIDTAVRALALALNIAGPRGTIVLAGGPMPAAFAAGELDQNLLVKPITREKLQNALQPLGLELPRVNCWEYMQCGREPGGRHAKDLGICPAAQEAGANGLHGGCNGGRACWAITGTMCGGKVQGSFASKIESCLECDFYQLVQCEEGYYFESIDSILNRLKRKKRP